MLKYDIIYITNIPSFYKINLFNLISKSKKIYVVFLKDQSNQRNTDFYKGDRNFEWISLDGILLIHQILLVFKLLMRSCYQSLIIDGWDNILYWISAFISPRIKNAVIIESSCFESKTKGWKGIIKKVFLNRISKSYASGKAQSELLLRLNFKGNIVITKGVGIFNIVKQPTFYPKEQIKNFIYVGRLSREKNLDYLIKTFAELPAFTLKIIGFGPLEKELKKIASENIRFCGAVDNSKLTIYFRENDALILPSLSEPWGLVVEEALNNGLPVIISERVGCGSEIIINDYNGIIFSLMEPGSLQKAILKMTDISFYNTLRKNISRMNFEETAQQQVTCYLQ